MEHWEQLKLARCQRSLAAARRDLTFYLADPSARLTTIASGGSSRSRGSPYLQKGRALLFFVVAAGVSPAFAMLPVGGTRHGGQAQAASTGENFV
jgi:hypothetical protein